MSNRLPVQAAGGSRLPNLTEHLEPERLVKRYGEAISTMAAQWAHADYLCYEVRRSPRSREEIRRGLAVHPSLGALAAVSEDIGTALTLKPDQRATQAAVAVLFDARVKGPQNPQVYLEALSYDLIDEGFAPCVVVGACQTLRRESVFTPEIAEIIAACRKKASTYRAVASLADRLFDTRERIEDAMKAADAEQPQPSETPPPGGRF